jgi:hypothetical protein
MNTGESRQAVKPRRRPRFVVATVFAGSVAIAAAGTAPGDVSTVERRATGSRDAQGLRRDERLAGDPW